MIKGARIKIIRIKKKKKNYGVEGPFAVQLRLVSGTELFVNSQLQGPTIAPVRLRRSVGREEKRPIESQSPGRTADGRRAQSQTRLNYIEAVFSRHLVSFLT